MIPSSWGPAIADPIASYLGLVCMLYLLFSRLLKALKSTSALVPGKSSPMATSGRRREGVLCTAPKFFKIILDPLAHTLRIPAEFLKRYGQNLPNRVFLKVPSGSSLEVELVQSNGETLFQKGWEEFKERYSIGFGHFLVFEYDGNSQFDVLIFDISATAINYPSHADFEVEDNGTESDDDSVVLLQHLSTSNRGKGKAKEVEDSDTECDASVEILDNPPGTQQNRRKRRRCDDTIGFSGNYPPKESLREMQNLSFCFKKESRTKFSLRSRVKLEESAPEECSDGTGRQCSYTVQKQRAVAKETSIAHQKALSFTRTHPLRNPFFISLMQPSYVFGRYPLSVPLTFVKENLSCESTNLTLRLRNGKAWTVRCIIGAENAKLSAGWKDFVEENGLKVGDACIFQATKSSKDFVWNVIIFRS